MEEHCTSVLKGCNKILEKSHDIENRLSRVSAGGILKVQGEDCELLPYCGTKPEWLIPHQYGMQDDNREQQEHNQQTLKSHFWTMTRIDPESPTRDNGTGTSQRSSVFGGVGLQGADDFKR